MCNFMGAKVTKLQFIKLLQIEKDLGTIAALEALEEMKDGFRYADAVIIRKAADAKDIDVVKAHWEFIPPWIKSGEELIAARKQGIPWLNARGETVLESRMFGNAARKRRCLVLASHFYEWRHFKPVGAKKANTYPYVISLRDKDYFYMAGIWQPWTDKSTGEIIDTFAILTTTANEFMSQVHNTKLRQPTILTEELAWEWIMEDLTDERIREIATYRINANEMQAHTIAKDFKTAPDPTAHFEYEGLPALV